MKNKTSKILLIIMILCNFIGIGLNLYILSIDWQITFVRCVLLSVSIFLLMFSIRRSICVFKGMES